MQGENSEKIDFKWVKNEVLKGLHNQNSKDFCNAVYGYFESTEGTLKSNLTALFKRDETEFAESMDKVERELSLIENE